MGQKEEAVRERSGSKPSRGSSRQVKAYPRQQHWLTLPKHMKQVVHLLLVMAAVRHDFPFCQTANNTSAVSMPTPLAEWVHGLFCNLGGTGNYSRVLVGNIFDEVDSSCTVRCGKAALAQRLSFQRCRRFNFLRLSHD
eukprot:1579748-Pyramimonas_sp.AAC.1